MIRNIFCFIIVIHGFIHLLGFSKAFHLVDAKQLPPISKSAGSIWLFASILLIATAILYFNNYRYWWIAGIVAALTSQLIILSMWQESKFGTIANVILLLASLIGYGTIKYRDTYFNDVSKNMTSNNKTDSSLLTENDIMALPEPVKKYIRYTGFIGKPKISSFKINFQGTIRKNETSEWMPFLSEQYNFMHSPTRLFFMNAAMLKLPVAGYHCYKEGNASMDIRLFSLIKVQYADGEKMNVAETVTFFNDMCCMAPGTLIDKRINWKTINDTIVEGNFIYKNISIKADLHFNATGQLTNFISDDRLSVTDDKKVRWSTPLSNYKNVNGYTLAGNAKTIYTYPEKDFCYGTFQLKSVIYNPVK